MMITFKKSFTHSGGGKEKQGEPSAARGFSLESRRKLRNKGPVDYALRHWRNMSSSEDLNANEAAKYNAARDYLAANRFVAAGQVAQALPQYFGNIFEAIAVLDALVILGEAEEEGNLYEAL